MREWIELGEREGLTFQELAERAGVCRKTLGRWSARLRKEGRREPSKLPSPEARARAEPQSEQARSAVGTPTPEGAFVELVERASPQGDQIQIVLSGNRRVVVDGAVDVEALVRVIAAVERC